MTTSRIELYIVRHGERQDEAIMANYYSEQRAAWNARQARFPFGLLGPPKMSFDQAVDRNLYRMPRPPQTDTLDPVLTRKGHSQAHNSLAKLTKSLSGRNSQVAVFCSPLRRAVGTVLMAGTVPVQETLLFPSPIDGSNDRSIPVVVLNELGDFASAVYKRGGTQELVPTGVLRCASMDANDGKATSPFVQAVRTMHSQMEAQKESTSVRFYRYNDTETSYSPIMAQPIQSVAQLTGQETSILTRPETPKSKKKRKPPPPPDPLLAVNKAVNMTVARGCSVCVIVAHREAIREMAEHCNYFGSISTPYCCIGSFGASVVQESGHGTTVHYDFHNVWSAENFRSASIPRSVPLLGRPMRGFASVMFIQPDQAPRHICTIRSTLVRGSLSSQIWLSPNGGKKKHKARKRNEKRGKSTESILNMEIVDGYQNWTTYVNHFGCTMIGWAGWMDLPDDEFYILKLGTTVQSMPRCLGLSVRML